MQITFPFLDNDALIRCICNIYVLYHCLVVLARLRDFATWDSISSMAGWSAYSRSARWHIGWTECNVLAVTSFWSQWLWWRLTTRSLDHSWGFGCLSVQALCLFSVNVASAHMSICADRLSLSKDLKVVKRLHLNELYSIVRIWVISNDWLQSVWINTMDLSDDSHFDILRVFFGNSHVRRRVVLFVTHQNVRH